MIETGAQQAVWERRIKPDYYSYMGLVFEKVCMDYLNAKNAKGATSTRVPIMGHLLCYSFVMGCLK